MGVVVLAGCSGGGVQGGGGGTQFLGGTGEISQFAEQDRKKAPDISGETVGGDQLKLSDYRGKVVVLNVWGSWCAPCRAEAPNLAKVAKDTADQGVQFVGINTRDYDRAQAKAFDRGYGITYPSFFDPGGKLILRFPDETLAPQLIPSTLVIDRQGRIAVRALKALTEEELRAMIDPLLESSKGSAGDRDTKGDEKSPQGAQNAQGTQYALQLQGSLENRPAAPAIRDEPVIPRSSDDSAVPLTPSEPARPVGQ